MRCACSVISSVLLKMVQVVRWKFRSLKLWIVKWYAATSVHTPLAKASHMVDVKVRGSVLA